jgi:DNA (cytosine-5)-methyltransferase 1
MSTPVPSVSSFNIIDLFAGPGGLDRAAFQLGIPATGIEWDKDACTTRGTNALNTVMGDVRKSNPADFPDCNVLAGGPPCQTFTVAGNGSGRQALDQVLSFANRIKRRHGLGEIRANLQEMEDERTGLVLEPLRWALQALDEKRPYQAIVLEQVPAVLPVWEAFAVMLRDEGYAVCRPMVLHTEEYGVPQTRRRAILIARWTGEGRMLMGEPALPAPTHQRYTKHRSAPGFGIEPWVAMAAVLTSRKTPFKVVSNYGTGGDPKARGVRLSDEPSATVTGKVSRNRVLGLNDRVLPRLSDSEAGELQTFPPFPDWKWAGNAVSQQIGNAIPPRFGMHVLAAALGIGEEALRNAIKENYTY